METLCCYFFLGDMNKHLFSQIGNQKYIKEMIPLKSSFVNQFTGLFRGP